MNNLGRQIIQQTRPRSAPVVRPADRTRTRSGQRYPASLVREVQERLNRLGYSAGVADGLMGPTTRAAIRAYQRDAGLPRTGRPDPAMMTSLRTAGLDGREEMGASELPPLPAEAEENRAFVQTQPSGSASFAELTGFDLPHGDYRSGLDDPALSGITVDACQAECRADPRCLSYTFNVKAEICILKDTVPAPAPYANAVSGIKVAANADQGIDQDSSGRGNAQSGAGMAAPVATGGADPAAAMGREPETVAPAFPSVAQARIPAGLPQWQGRLLLGGRGDFKRPDGSQIETANEAFADMAMLVTLRKYPEIMESDETAFDLFRLLDLGTQARLAAEANVEPAKVVGEDYHGADLNEFERPRLFRVIREQVPDLLLQEAPSLPLPALVLCVPGVGDYDFSRQVFPFSNNCDVVASVDYHTQKVNDIRVEAPVPGGRLPDELPVPANGAEAYKHEHFQVPQSAFTAAGSFSRGTDRSWHVFSGVAVRVTDVVRGRRDDVFELKIEPEQLHLFRIDRMDTPFATLDIIPLPSLATVSAEPDGPLPVDDDTLALIMMKRGSIDVDDEAFRTWASERMHLERTDWPEGWADFFARGLPEDLSRRPEDLSAELVSSFADWTRARAEALPETAPLIATSWYFGGMATEEGSSSVFAFRSLKEGSSDAKRLSKRLAIPAERLSVPKDRSFGAVPGVGPIEDVVLVLPSPVDSYVVQLDETPETSDDLDAIVTARLGDLRVVRSGEGAPLVVLEIEPLSARVVRSDGDARGEEIGTAQFDSLPQPQPVETASGPLPLGAEVTDLLRLRYLPETVDDQVLLRMMLSRFAYEAAAPEPVFGGRFFRDVSERPPLGELQRRLPEFRAWEEARARDLPDRMEVALELRRGVAPYEGRGADTSLRGSCMSALREEAAGESPTERDEAERRVCHFLETASNTPDRILFLNGRRYGPKGCADRDPYCRSIDYAREEVGMDRDEDIHDLVRLDRLPVLDRQALASSDRELELKLVFSLAGVEAAHSWPETVYEAATRQAAAFGERYGVDPPVQRPGPLPGPTFIFDAKLLEARVVDAETGEVVAEPELAVPTAPPADLLSLDWEAPAEWDILGIHLGDSFEEAEAAIRAHMPVDRVLFADPSALTESMTGPPPPFSSGRMYVSEEQREAIAIFDEPPTADDKVLGIWRLVKVPKGALDPASLAAVLRERYGEPAAVDGSGDRAEFLWSQFRPDCGGISNTHQNDLWRDADGAPAVPPEFAKSQHYYPDLWVSSYGLISDDGTRSEMSSLCPAVLGVEYQRWSAVPAADDELVSWLHDQRAYAEAYYDSRDAEAEAAETKPSAAPEALGVKF